MDHRMSTYSNATDTTESSDENYQETWLESDTMDDLITGKVFLDEIHVKDDVDGGDCITINPLHPSPRRERLRSKTYSMCSTTSTCSCGSFSVKERCLSDLSASMDYTYLNSPALSVRVIGTATVSGQLVYSIRAEDEVNGTWTIQKTYKELYTLYKQVKTLSTSPVNTPFWGTLRALRKCRVPKRLFRLKSQKSITCQRMVIMDSFIRQTAMIVQPRPLGPQRQQVLDLLHAFIGLSPNADAPKRTTAEYLLRKSSFMQSSSCCACSVASEKPSATDIERVISTAFDSHVAASCEAFIEQFTQRAATLYVPPSKSLLAKKSSCQETRISKENADAMMDCIKTTMADLKAQLLDSADVVEFLRATRLKIADPEVCEQAAQHIRREASSIIQTHVYVALEDDIAECLRAIVPDSDDEALVRKIRLLARKPQTAFGVKSGFSAEDWIHARSELGAMDLCTLPIDKLKCIMNAAMGVYQTVVESQCEGNNSPANLTLSADDFVPIHIYVVLTSLLLNPLVTKELLALVTDPTDLTGKIGFYFTNFVAAIDHIAQLSE
ncbi:hypothetical protein DYB32_004638 [Aphanomyces invadans]|nr:hypothetical protein DYB32_004638 [Aphanomyces invadans]